MKECTECKHCNERGYYTGKWYCTNPKISVFRVPDVVGDCFEPRAKGTAGQQNAVDKYQRMTNADRIRAMSDNELSDFLDNVFNGFFDGFKFPCERCTDRANCDGCFSDWLKLEVEE